LIFSKGIPAIAKWSDYYLIHKMNNYVFKTTISDKQGRGVTVTDLNIKELLERENSSNLFYYVKADAVVHVTKKCDDFLLTIFQRTSTYKMI
jgi:hypothetical protein